MLWFVLLPVALFVVLTAYLYFYQKSFVFFPVKELAASPDQLGLGYEDIFIDVTSGERIHAWYFPNETTSNEPKRAVLFCHGNAGNISHRLPTAQLLAELNVAALLFDYRGYGRSDGRVGETEAYADARAAFDWLVNEKGFAPEEIIIFGRSLGGAVAIELATQVKCAGLLVESSFTSVLEMGRKAFPILPIGLLLKYKFESDEKIGTVACRALFVHSPQDDIIPFEMGRVLYDRAVGPKQFFEISGRHNEREYLADPGYIQTVRSFIYDASGPHSE